MHEKRIDVADITPLSFELQVELVGGEEGTPLANTRYKMAMPDGEIREGSSDANGLITEDTVPPGQATLYLALGEQEDVNKALAEAADPERGGETRVV